MAAVSEGSTFKIDWDAIEEMSRTVAGGSDRVDWDLSGVSEEEGKNLFGRAVDGVGEWLAGLRNIKINFPKREAAPAKPKENVFTRMLLGVRPDNAASAPAESQPQEKDGFFDWLRGLPLLRNYDQWVDSLGKPSAPKPEGDKSEKGAWLENSWKWLAGAPGELINKFRRKDAAAAAVPIVSRAERVRALREGTKQFVEQHGLGLAMSLAGMAGVGVGAMVVSPESIGIVNAFSMELSALGVATTSMLGVMIGDSRGPEFIPSAEKAYQRPIRAIQRLCSQRAVRSGLFVVGASSAGFAVGGMGRIVVDILQVIQQGAGAGTPEPGNLANVWSPEPGAAADWEARRQAVGQLVQVGGQAIPGETVTDVAKIVSQSETAFAQAGQTLSSISADLSGNSSVSPLVDSAQQTLRTANQFYSDAMASGGIDATEAAKLKELASQAQQLVDQALEAARVVAQQNAQAAAGAADAEAIRQGVLQDGQAMKDVIAATPSGTPFEALQQVAWQTTRSPFSAEVANAISWTLPKGDITGLHTGAIGEAAKKVAELISQAHDYAAGHGVSYTINSIRQAVDAGQLSVDVLKAVEAGNAPVGAVKEAAISGLNTVLQTVVK